MQTFYMLQLSIPKPCHKDWEAMTPNQQGRHCNVCAKTVVDFTGMDDAAVQHYFLNRKEISTCGRFKQEQVSRITISLPADILQINLPKWKQFLAACLLAFSSMLFSCDMIVTQGELTGVILPPVAELKDTTTNIDTIPQKPAPTRLTEQNCTILTGDTIFIQPALQGDLEIKIVDTTPVSKPAFTQADMLVTNDSIIFTGMVTSKFPKSDSAKTKNPPTADSTDCNNMKYY